MFGSVLPAKQLLHGTERVRILFYHGQRYLPGPHHLPGHDASEPLHREDAEDGRECKGPTQVRLSHAQPDCKWLQVLDYIYDYLGG